MPLYNSPTTRSVTITSPRWSSGYDFRLSWFYRTSAGEQGSIPCRGDFFVFPFFFSLWTSLELADNNWDNSRHYVYRVALYEPACLHYKQFIKKARP